MVFMDTAVKATRSAGRNGAVAMLPLLVGYVPFALVIGSAAAESASPLAGWSGSWLIFGGSAHLAALRTLRTAGPAAAILTGLLINARLIVYSASLARRWAGQPSWFRVAGAGLIVDPTWAIAERHADDSVASDVEQRRFFLAAGLTLGMGWCAAIGAGVLLGARLDWIRLDIVVPLCLLGLVGGSVATRAARPGLLAAAVVAYVTASWPAGTGLLLAVVAGAVTGRISDGRRPQ
jgi:predicted branched-subunit amino acid permease